tara:strand:- start:186 stop:296 length:111 start_codon:yes stop_codon:yes gene_type:complete
VWVRVRVMADPAVSPAVSGQFQREIFFEILKIKNKK